MKRIMIVDDHTIFRQGIVSLLRSEEGFEVVAEAGSGSAAVKLAGDLKPDIIIMDISLPDISGIEAVKIMKKTGVAGNIIFLTMHNDPALLERAFEIGVKGYLLKDDALDDLLYAMKAVIRGERFTSSSLNEATAGTKGMPVPHPILTRREGEIVALIAEGLSSKEIAEKLFISIKTVETHRARIMEKLNLGSLAELVRYAVKTGIIKP